MPELPEVETTRAGLEPHLLDQRIARLEVREPRLRWPIPAGLGSRLAGARINALTRRGKYLLLQHERGGLLLHLGMSGSLRISDVGQAPGRHDHYDLLLENGCLLRYCDPRRFGCLLELDAAGGHPLLNRLGPEPLAADFDGDLLYRLSRGRRTAVKPFLMDASVVVGVGNIYASEALFLAGIHPARACGRISADRYRTLADAVRTVLSGAIRRGGTTLRDYVNGVGKPGYFQQELNVYGRQGQTCRRCGQPLKDSTLGQRGTVWCPGCQR